VRATPLGWGVAACTIILGAAAVLLRYTELAALAAACLVALVIAVASVARWPAVAVEITVQVAHVRRGEPATATLQVANIRRSRRAPAFFLDVACGAGQAVVLRVPAIRGGAAREFAIELDTGARGVVVVGPARVRRADPFGLVVRAGRAGGTAAVWVRPYTVPLEPLASPRSREPDGPRSDGAGGAVLFNSLREYLPGDDLRFVHWPSSARAGMLLVRQHADPSEPTATVVLDTRRQAYPNGPAGAAAFEEAVDVAASVVSAFAERRYPVRLVTSGGLAMHNRRRRSGVGRLLDALADVTMDGVPATEDGVPATEDGGPAADDGGPVAGSRQAAEDHGRAMDGRPGLGVLASLPRGGVGSLTLVTGGVEIGQIAAVSRVVHRFEQVVVVRVGKHRYPLRPALRRLAPVPLTGGVSPLDTHPVSTLRHEDQGWGSLDDEPAVHLAGRLRVVAVSHARDLPSRWPVDGRRTPPTASKAGDR
jgi:uncharacterized protein (DUF58 family)